jgi:hypothetical protein
MIKFENYQFRFFYPEKNSDKKITTQCVVEKQSKRLLSREIKSKVVGVGIAHCSMNDNFCKEEGRKLSLVRAMKEAGLSKEKRHLVWELYRNSKRGGRW